MSEKWSVSEDYKDDIVNERGTIIAQVCDESKANLIAAAPEMYEALDDLLNCGGIRSNEPGDAPAKAVWNAMQVLAKARGEQQ